MKDLHNLFYCENDQYFACSTSLEQYLTVLVTKTWIFLKKMVGKTEQNGSKSKKTAIFKVQSRSIYMVNSSCKGMMLV